MNFYEWPTVFEALLLVCGLLTAFISTHYTERVMSEEQRGVAVRVPDPNNPDEDKRKSFISWTDLKFLHWLGSCGYRRDDYWRFFCRYQGVYRQRCVRF
jgi:hypothetical protein